MAIAASNLVWGNLGTRKTVKGTLTFSGSYTAGGETVTPASIGLLYVEELILTNPNAVGIDALWNYSKTAPKVILNDEDNISGVAAEASGTRTDVIAFLAIGF